MSNSTVYEKVVASLIEQMEKGVVPWVRPWTASPLGNMPFNITSRRPYSGVNVLTLWLTAMDKSYETQGWLTFNQARGAKLKVRAGEKGTYVMFWKVIEKKDANDSTKIDKIFLARGYSVFNLDQCDEVKEGAKAKLLKVLDRKGVEWNAIAECEQMIADTGARIVTGDAAAYSPTMDVVKMPSKEQFPKPEGYYATMFHELGHWTGHESRLDRKLSTSFGTEDYAKEELVAELTAAFLSASYGFDVISQSATYLSTWLAHAKEDKSFLVKAASQASKATAFLLEPAAEGMDQDDAATETEAVAA